MARKHVVSAQSSGCTILVVDDQPEILKSNQAFLENAGHRVFTAGGGAEALSIFQASPVDLILVDYFMPCMNGGAVIRAIRKLDEDVQIVLQTGYSGDTPALALLHELDIQGYHDKADGPDRLLVWVEVALKTMRYIRKMRQAEQLKTELLANVSHELRTPLNGILGYSDVLLGEDYQPPLPPAAVADIAWIHEQARHLERHVDNFLNFSALETAHAPGMDIALQRVQLTDFQATLQSLMGLFLRDKNVTFQCNFPPGLPAAWADPQKLSLILCNLVSNAAKFTLAGTISVSARCNESDRTLTVQVEDSGIGIATEYHETIFEAFRQVDGSSTRRFGGLGIGLALARRLARRMDGELSVDSQAGTGSTFTLRLQLAPDSEDMQPGAESEGLTAQSGVSASS